MRKLCYNCKFYGQCHVESKVCQDWTEFTGEGIVLNIEQFDQKWKSRHKRWYMKLDPTIIQKRIENKLKHLSGKTVDEYTKEAEEGMLNEAESIGQNT